MKKKKEKLDFVLEQNTDEQLAEVNWDQLNTAISQKLNRTNRSSQYRLLFKIAAVFAIAAAVGLCAICIKTQPPVNKEIHSAAIVTFPQRHGSAKVEIFDSDIQDNTNAEQSSWIFIRKQQPVIADNRLNKDEIDVACIF